MNFSTHGDPTRLVRPKRSIYRNKIQISHITIMSYILTEIITTIISNNIHKQTENTQFTCPSTAILRL